MIDVEPGTLYRWQVFLNAAGGSITIPPEHARATIWGQGLVAIGKWDGYIDAEDTFGVIPLDDITVAAFEDIPLINKESLYITGTTWQTVKESTWAQIKDAYTW